MARKSRTKLTDAVELTTRPEQYKTIRRLVTIWLRALLKRNKKYPILLPELDDLQELRVMLSQRIEKWAEGYIAEGEQKGRLQGQLEGEARLLGRLLKHRFGALPAWVESRLNEATEAQLLAWSETVLDAATLAEVFEEPPANH